MDWNRSFIGQNLSLLVAVAGIALLVGVNAGILRRIDCFCSWAIVPLAVAITIAELGGLVTATRLIRRVARRAGGSCKQR